MKLPILILACFFISNLTLADCVINTDDEKSPRVENGSSTWKYLSENPDCKITRMNLSEYWSAKDSIDVIPFNFQFDQGHHGIAKSTIGICSKNIRSGVISCTKSAVLEPPLITDANLNESSFFKN